MNVLLQCAPHVQHKVYSIALLNSAYIHTHIYSHICTYTIHIYSYIYTYTIHIPSTLHTISQDTLGDTAEHKPATVFRARAAKRKLRGK